MQNNNREFHQQKEIVLEKWGASSAEGEMLATHLTDYYLLHIAQKNDAWATEGNMSIICKIIFLCGFLGLQVVAE